MKKVVIIVVFLAFTVVTFAQDNDIKYRDKDEFKTIFGGKTLGGYGGIGVGYTLIEDRPGVTFDARGGVVMGHYFALGIGGSGFVNTSEYVQADNANISLAGGYGGIFAEFILFPRSQVHLSFPVLAGIGGIAATSFIEDAYYYEYQSNVEQTSVFMIVEPAVELEFNFTRFFRMSGYFSYRYTTDVEMDNLYASNDALINYSAGIRFKFGKF